jgi:hypothetical protein
MRYALIALFLGACASEADSDTDIPAAPACGELTDGTYTASGTCFGMDMTAELVFEATTCAFTIDNWDMNHPGLPETGTVSDGSVTLGGGNYDGCTGTVDGTTLAGTCDDGCTWSFTAVSE